MTLQRKLPERHNNYLLVDVTCHTPTFFTRNYITALTLSLACEIWFISRIGLTKILNDACIRLRFANRTYGLSFPL